MSRVTKLIIAVAVAGGLILAGVLATEASDRQAPGSSAPFGGVTHARTHLGAAASLAKASRSSSAAGGKITVTGGLAPLVVRTGSLTLAVRKASVDAVFNDVSATAVALGGFVQSSTSGTLGGVPTPTGAPSASLTVRVPTARFAVLEHRVSALGRVRSVAVNGTDVTGESINLEARIANLKSEEAALRRLMGRAGSIAAILRVQNELFSVEGQIESLAAEEGSLLNRATYGTLFVAIVPLSAAVVPHKKGEDAVVRAVRLAVHNCLAVLRAIALGLGWAFPAFLVAGALALALWLRRRLLGRRPHSVPGAP